MNNCNYFILHLGLKTYFIERLPDEINNYSERMWLIANMQPRNEVELDEIVKLSKFWHYMRHDGCRYPPEIEKQVEKMETNLRIKNEPIVHPYII